MRPRSLGFAGRNAILAKGAGRGAIYSSAPIAIGVNRDLIEVYWR